MQINEKLEFLYSNDKGNWEEADRLELVKKYKRDDEDRQEEADWLETLLSQCLKPNACHRYTSEQLSEMKARLDLLKSGAKI